MATNIAQKLIASHLVSGEMEPGGETGSRIDQALRAARQSAERGAVESWLGARRSAFVFDPCHGHRKSRAGPGRTDTGRATSRRERRLRP